MAKKQIQNIEKINPRVTLSKEQQKRVKSMTIELVKRQTSLTKKDIGTWRRAQQMAENVENPQRNQLYSIYKDAMIDGHLTGCVEQLKGMVIQKAFRLNDKKTKKEVSEKTEIFEQKWFKDFMKYAIESKLWGYSLVQFGDILIDADNLMRFENIELVPRENVMPEFGVIIKEVGDEPKQGYSFTEGKIAKWCIGIGDKDDLGLLLKASKETISKKNMLAFWDAFGEMFGMPVRIGKTSSSDTNELNKIENALASMGSEFWAMFPEGTSIDFVETSRGDAFNVYDKRIDRANSEISKAILVQTMTIDSGSSYSQSEVHLTVLRNLVESYADLIRDCVNNQLLPFMLMHGFPVENLRFEWDNSVEYTPEQIRQIEQMLLSFGYEIDSNYFTEKYNIPITGYIPPRGTQLQMSKPVDIENPDFDFFV
jgi:hypothetical protein